jgi:hypothetical protein
MRFVMASRRLIIGAVVEQFFKLGQRRTRDLLVMKVALRRFRLSFCVPSGHHPRLLDYPLQRRGVGYDRGPDGTE